MHVISEQDACELQTHRHVQPVATSAGRSLPNIRTRWRHPLTPRPCVARVLATCRRGLGRHRYGVISAEVVVTARPI